jgi:cell division control protein 6
MAHRADAFKSGILEDDTIPLAAAFAAGEHGDARKAFDILRNAGEIAVEEDDATVGEPHVRKARSRADVNRFSDLVRNQPHQVKVILLALASLVSSHDEPKIPSSDIYQQYCDFAAIVDVSQLSQRRVYDLLQEQAFLDILGQEFEGRGRARGSVMKFFLLEDPETVVQAITEQTDRFDALLTVF